MSVGFMGTSPTNGGQPLLYQYTKNETEIIQITIEALAY